MRFRGLSSCALSICAAAAMPTGCGGSQLPIAAPQSALESAETMPQHPVSQSLLYVVSTGGVVDVLSYPGLKSVGTLEAAKGTTAPITSNPANGNVLIDVRGIIYEFAHGGKEPIAQIQTPPDSDAADYAFDPTSENIAVSIQTGSRNGSVLIYPSPSNSPTQYTVPNVQYPYYTGYDPEGDLFVQGRTSGEREYVFAELPKGGSEFQDISLNQNLTEPGTVQWDGSYITVANGNSIWQLQVSGSEGTVVGQTTLNGAWTKQPTFWIQDGTIIGDLTSQTHTHNGRSLGFWNYPQGGKAYKKLEDFIEDKHDRIISEAVSVKP
jgi:hypothetical protein